jgi:tetratricopeptide (TPR) repeat protein
MNRRTLAALVFALLGSLLPPSVPSARACIWDSDTLADELRGIPEAEALLVTDRWFRHGPAYYRARVASMPARIARDRFDFAAYDDLAVAHERLGEREKALEVLAAKERVLVEKPDAEHRYRLHANRGTVLSHAGRLEEALPEIERAVALHPDAHFGRERFQVDALRYFLAAKKDPDLFRRATILSHGGVDVTDEKGDSVGTGHSVQMDPSPPAVPGDAPPKPRPESWRNCWTAMAGILRFGGVEGAEVYRVLGDLALRRPGSDHGDRHLAWWAYRRALAKGHPAKEEVGEALRRLEHHWEGTGLLGRPNEVAFAAMLASAEAWHAAFAAAEEAAVLAGEDVASDEALRRFTAAADSAAGDPPSATRMHFRALLNLEVILPPLLAMVVIACVLFLGVRNARRARSRLAGTPPAGASP